MKHLLITITLLFGAIICYAAGFGHGILFLVLTGAAVELVFWVRTIKAVRNK